MASDHGVGELEEPGIQLFSKKAKKSRSNAAANPAERTAIDKRTASASTAQLAKADEHAQQQQDSKPPAVESTGQRFCLPCQFLVPHQDAETHTCPSRLAAHNPSLAS